MKLEDKITSLEEYLTVQLPDGSGSVKGLLAGDDGWYLRGHVAQCFIQKNRLGGLPQIKNLEYIPKQFWWVHRELMRMQFGIYAKPTAALTTVNNLMPFHHLLAHMSKDDPNQIAFTANAEDGMRDRQTRVAFGRFLRKAYNFMTDDAIAQYEAAHRTELNPPIEFIVAETHPKEFLAAYRAISSCMSKSNREYHTKDLMHPVECYCAPGWQLAVLKNGDGGHSARSLVWINPADPTDKRMVRTYGDTVLDTWLKNNGFKMRSFEGAWLKTIAVPGHRHDGKDGIACPYIDTGASNDPNGRGVWDGADKLYLLGRHSSKVSADYIIATQVSSGIAYAKPFPLNRPCMISGGTINALVDGFVETWRDGTFGYAKAEAAVAANWKQIYIKYAKRAYAPPDTPTFKHGSGNYLESDATRKELGYFKLAAKFYPDDQSWHTNTDLLVAETDDGWVLADDLFTFIDHQKRARAIHKSALPKDAVRVVMLNERKTWADPQLELVRTAANRMVVPNVHPVVQGWDNRWYFSKNMKQANFLGTKIWIPVNKELAELDITELPAQVSTSIEQAVQASENLANAKRRALFSIFSRQGDMLCPKEEVAGGEGKLEALYVFDWREIPIKLVEPWLRAEWVPNKIVGAPEGRMRTLHQFGRRVLDMVEAHEKWAAKAAPTKAAAAAEPVAMAA